MSVLKPKKKPVSGKGGSHNRMWHKSNKPLQVGDIKNAFTYKMAVSGVIRNIV